MKMLLKSCPAAANHSRSSERAVRKNVQQKNPYILKENKPRPRLRRLSRNRQYLQALVSYRLFITRLITENLEQQRVAITVAVKVLLNFTAQFVKKVFVEIILTVAVAARRHHSVLLAV